MSQTIQPRSPWSSVFPNALILLAALFFGLAALRAYGYYGSDLFNGQPVMLGFVLMWFIPFVFFDAQRRRQMGFVKPRSLLELSLPILAGAALAGLCYALGLLLYGKSDQNWFVSVGFTFISDERAAAMPREAAFIAFTIPAMIASPIGEEFFFRGLVHHAVEEKSNWRVAAYVNSGLFAAVHLIHHGIHRTYTGYDILPVSGAIWFALMFATSFVFTLLVRRSGSIWSGVAAHSAFNLVMNVTIFYSLLVQPV